MDQVIAKIDGLDWAGIGDMLHDKGYAQIPAVLNEAACRQVSDLYDQDALFRKTVVMERFRFGLGEYKYFSYPLPGLLAAVRETLYRHLAPVANSWMHVLGEGRPFPDSLQAMLARCRAAGQTLPTVLQLRYGPGGYNTLHQDLYGELFFPIQAVIFLKQPGTDYTGGAFVLTEQVPRAQSKVIVLQPARGDLLLFTTGFRPVKGSRGYYRVTMKHGVSEVKEGRRETLGIIFHDAQS
ncbi:2OG-Fe(II) oxygenase [Pedobacter sp. SYP-B3415]|uniref:2OG-Fe(II) oxygenase n=1 Tax=Pedobacter sp. SYP-B3415 TaxID=2496641 RepID=UPI00101D0505|nr:2OG-Fe(II) oxygenase [Pedobacter sp. SYP-B3415]